MFRNSQNRWIAVVGVIVLIIGLVLVSTRDAEATSDGVCVPSPAVPAVPGTPEVPAVTETVTTPATPDLWWNWSPNDTKGPQDYEPAFPVDARGTWQGPHANGGPQQDTYGTFNTSNENSGNSSWFHREHGTPETTTTVVITPAIPATPGTPAIPAVECPEPPTPTETPTVPTETPTVPVPTETVTPEVPVVTPPVVETPADECAENTDVIPRDVLYTIDGEIVTGDEYYEFTCDDAVVKTSSSSSPTKTVKTQVHSSGAVSKIVRSYKADELKEEGL